MNKQTITTTNWLTKGVPESQLKTEKELAVISAKIYTRRLEMGLDQKEFAKYMGVTQGLVSRWESGTYNFSISTLINICEKLGLSFESQILEKEEIVIKNTIYISIAKIDYSDEWENWIPLSKNILVGGAI